MLEAAGPGSVDREGAEASRARAEERAAERKTGASTGEGAGGGGGGGRPTGEGGKGLGAAAPARTGANACTMRMSRRLPSCGVALCSLWMILLGRSLENLVNLPSSLRPWQGLDTSQDVSCV